MVSICLILQCVWGEWRHEALMEKLIIVLRFTVFLLLLWKNAVAWLRFHTDAENKLSTVNREIDPYTQWSVGELQGYHQDKCRCKDPHYSTSKLCILHVINFYIWQSQCVILTQSFKSWSCTAVSTFSCFQAKKGCQPIFSPFFDEPSQMSGHG